MAKTRSRGVKGRTTHVVCDTPAGYRWLIAHKRGADIAPDGSFRVTNEADWAASLQAAGGKECP